MTDFQNLSSEEYFKAEGMLTLEEFLVESMNHASHRDDMKDALGLDALPPQWFLDNAHSALQTLGWHFEAHGSQDLRLAIFDVDENGKVFAVKRTRAEWNYLANEAISHQSAESFLSDLLGTSKN